MTYLESYLSNQNQFTVVNGICSHLASVKFEVPQGLIIGLPCFSVNVNDMSENVDCNLDQLADDSTAHTLDSNTDIIIGNLQQSANQLESFAKNDSLTIHPGKCKVLVMSKHRFNVPLQNLQICNK